MHFCSQGFTTHLVVIHPPKSNEKACIVISRSGGLRRPHRRVLPNLPSHHTRWPLSTTICLDAMRAPTAPSTSAAWQVVVRTRSLEIIPLPRRGACCTIMAPNAQATLASSTTRVAGSPLATHNAGACTPSLAAPVPMLAPVALTPHSKSETFFIVFLFFPPKPKSYPNSGYLPHKHFPGSTAA